MIDSLASHLLTSSWSQSPTAEYSTEITRRQCFQQELWGLVHMETLLCVNSHVFASFCLIVHVDPIINTLFWNLISRWKNSKTPPLCSCVDSESAYLSMTPSPRPSTSRLRPLNPTTSQNNNNNNNNGGLRACVGAAEDTEPIRVTRAKYSAALPLHWAEKDHGRPTSHFCTQALWACSVSSSQAPPIGLEYELQRVETFYWSHLDTNILETMPRKTEEKRCGVKTCRVVEVWICRKWKYSKYKVP